MAERWLRCAELFTKQSLAARDMAPARRSRSGTLRWGSSLNARRRTAKGRSAHFFFAIASAGRDCHWSSDRQ